jgi:hypothetical protein
MEIRFKNLVYSFSISVGLRIVGRGHSPADVKQTAISLSKMHGNVYSNLRLYWLNVHASAI